jgi:hypothetical protein
MSTRGVTGYVANGKWYVTYNHSDSYPSWLGMRVLEFCKTVKNWDLVKERVSKLTLVNGENQVDEDVKGLYYQYYNNPNVALGSMDAKDKSANTWYWFLRSLQGEEILKEVAEGIVVHMIDSHDFMRDSLFCEWGYIIDLDEMVLRVYKGFNKAFDPNSALPPDIANDYFENSKGSMKDLDGKVSEWDNNYYPVKELYAYSLYNLPEFMLGVTNEFKEEYRKKSIYLEKK